MNLNSFTPTRHSIVRVTSAISLALLFVFAALQFAHPADGSEIHYTPEANSISGIVTSPTGGLPEAGSYAALFGSDEALKGISQLDISGRFEFNDNLANGQYFLLAIPPDESEFTNSQPQIISLVGAAVDVGTVALTIPDIVGTIYEPDGTTPIEARIQISHDGNEFYNEPAPEGEIKIGGLFSGTYQITALPKAGDPYWKSEEQTITVTTGISQSLDFILQPANAIGQVVDVTQSPIPFASVIVWGQNTFTYRFAIADEEGNFAIGELPDDTYTLVVHPPFYTKSLAKSEEITFEVPPELNDLGQIILPNAPKTVIGRVTTNAGDPVDNAVIIAHRIGIPGGQEVETNANGLYTLNLTAGIWSLTVRPDENSGEIDWIYSEVPQFVHFDDDRTEESKNINFEVLTADSGVTGVIEMPDGSVPSFPVAVSVRNNEGLGHDVLIDPVDGSYEINLPNGQYVFYVQSGDDGYAGPNPEHITIGVQSVLNLGTKSLISRDSTIVGSVVDENNHGIEGVQLIAWSDSYQNAQAGTAQDGSYTLAVVPGKWTVRPAVPAELPYIYAGEPISVEVSSGQLITNKDFVLISAPNSVEGSLADGDNLVIVDGWLTAVDATTEEPVNGAPIEAGNFNLNLPDGTYLLRPHLAPGSDYIPANPISLTVSGGETVETQLPVLEKTASINGALWDPRYEETVTDVPAVTFGSNPNAFVATAINTENGAYHLGLTEGIWHIGYYVDPSSDYVSLNHRRNIPLEEGQNVVYPLRVAAKDAALTGQVTDPAGNGLPNAIVFAEGTSPLLDEVVLHAVTDEFGNFYLPVPFGSYRMWSGIDNQSWLTPVETRVNVGLGQVKTGISLMYRDPNATLSGTVSLADASELESTVHIFAYGEDGAASFTQSAVGETYTLPVADGQTWHIVAAVEASTGTFYAIRNEAFVSGDTTLDLILQGPFTKPTPVAVTFDADQEQEIVLEDGTEIYIPAGAMPVGAGESVTLHITPVATLPHQHHARLYKYGYAFIALDQNGTQITSNFNQNVYITFSYQDAEVSQLNLNEDRLVPAYFSTSSNTWILPQSYVVDQDHNQVVLGIDHFTDFALINGAPDETVRVMLPMISR